MKKQKFLIRVDQQCSVGLVEPLAVDNTWPGCRHCVAGYEQAPASSSSCSVQVLQTRRPQPSPPPRTPVQNDDDDDDDDDKQ